MVSFKVENFRGRDEAGNCSCDSVLGLDGALVILQQRGDKLRDADLIDNFDTVLYEFGYERVIEREDASASIVD